METQKAADGTKRTDGFTGRGAAATAPGEALPSRAGARAAAATPVGVSRAFIKPACVKRPPFVPVQHKQAPDRAGSVAWGAKKAPRREPRGTPRGGPARLALRWRVPADTRAHTHARTRTDVDVRTATRLSEQQAWKARPGTGVQDGTRPHNPRLPARRLWVWP